VEGLSQKIAQLVLFIVWRIVLIALGHLVRFVIR
jgi:hypothetical protein